MNGFGDTTGQSCRESPERDGIDLQSIQFEIFNSTDGDEMLGNIDGDTRDFQHMLIAQVYGRGVIGFIFEAGIIRLAKLIRYAFEQNGIGQLSTRLIRADQIDLTVIGVAVGIEILIHIIFELREGYGKRIGRTGFTDRTEACHRMDVDQKAGVFGCHEFIKSIHIAQTRLVDSEHRLLERIHQTEGEAGPEAVIAQAPPIHEATRVVEFDDLAADAKVGGQAVRHGVTDFTGAAIPFNLEIALKKRPDFLQFGVIGDFRKKTKELSSIRAVRHDQHRVMSTPAVIDRFFDAGIGHPNSLRPRGVFSVILTNF